MASEKKTRVYIGDGVYATFDGYAVTLDTQRNHGTHYIVLEPSILQALILYAEKHMGKPNKEK